MRVRMGVLVAALLLAGCAGQGPEPSPIASSAGATPSATLPAPSTPGITTPPAASPTPNTTRPAATVRGPAQGASWQIQYTGTLSIAGASIVDVDGAEATKATVDAIHAAGGYAICYFNAGGWEDWRADATAYPDAVRGRGLDDWPGERWLDVRRLDVLMPIIGARMDDCAAKGFDAVDPDNIDGWQNQTGFALTEKDAIAFVEAMASEAHRRGLAIGLKNAVELVPAVAGKVDFAVNEECVAYDECDAYSPMLAQGKAVLHVEYEGSLTSVCAARPAAFSTVLKDRDLGPARRAC